MKEKIKTNANKFVGEKIRAIRHQKGWSQEYMAHQLGISVPALSKIETALTDINLSRLEQIANIFQMQISTLMKDSIEVILPQPLQSNQIDKNILDREDEISDLQRRLIGLYEELRANAQRQYVA